MEAGQTFEQFAFARGLVTDYDVQAHIHAGLMAAHMPNRYHRWYRKRLHELQDKREQAKALYAEALASGEVTKPRSLSRTERLELAARGHPDLPSTQAAIRLLARMQSVTA